MPDITPKRTPRKNAQGAIAPVPAAGALEPAATTTVTNGVERTRLAVSGKRPANAPKPMPLLLPHDSWATVQLIDTETRHAIDSGRPMVRLTFEVVRPRLYAGLRRFYTLHDGLERTLDSLAERFPGVDWLDEDDVWAQLRGVPLRAHFGREFITDLETGERIEHDRVVGFYLSERDRAEKAVEACE